MSAPMERVHATLPSSSVDTTKPDASRNNELARC